jgi:hypothetical protein
MHVGCTVERLWSLLDEKWQIYNNKNNQWDIPFFETDSSPATEVKPVVGRRKACGQLVK